MILNDHIDGSTLLFSIDLTVTLLSLCGSFLMSCFCLKRMRTSATITLRFIFALALADFFFAIANIISVFETEPDETSSQFSVGVLCHIEAVIREFSYILSIFFASCIAILCYKDSTLEYFNKRLYLQMGLLAGVLYSLILALTPLFIRQIAYTKGPQFCWITYSDKVTSDNIKLLIRIVYEGNPIILGLIITILAYSAAARRLSKLSQEVLNRMKVSPPRLFLYPAALFLGFVPCLIDNIIGIYYSKRPIPIQALHIVLTHSIGFTNALIYWGQRSLYDDLCEKVRPGRSIHAENEEETIPEHVSSLSQSLMRATENF